MPNKKSKKFKSIKLSDKEFQILHRLVNTEKINIELFPNKKIVNNIDEYAKQLRNIEQRLICA